MQIIAISCFSPFLLAASLSAGCGGSASESPDAGGLLRCEPARVVLTHTFEDPSASGVRFSDATLTGPEDADIFMNQAQVLSLGMFSGNSLCEKGIFESIEDIPLNLDDCPASGSGEWTPRVYLSASTIHATPESERIGLGILAWNADRTALYKLLVVGDSYNTQGVSTVSFDYERVVASEPEVPDPPL
tara:strand:+ start:76057 stop:76623 length:567 start_codon:yes stop_codon:yes gene_type:complete